MVLTSFKGLRLAMAVSVLCLLGMGTAPGVAAKSENAPENNGLSISSQGPGSPVADSQMARLRLSEKDVAVYRKIFTARARGNMGAVATLEKQVSDTSLLDWAHMRKVAAPEGLWLPQTVGTAPRVYRPSAARDKHAENLAETVAITVALMLKTDDMDRARGVVDRALTANSIDRIEAAQLWAQIAAAHLYANHPRQAQLLAHLALQIGGLVVPEAGWTAGLASWVVGDYDRAARYFSWAPRSPYADPWLRSASSFWTARALMRTGHYNNVSRWLKEAARHPRSFYGLIATRALGARFEFNWSVPPLNQRHLAVLAKYPGAVRALKLAQLGQVDMARLELALLDEKAAKDWREALAALAGSALKPDTAIQVAGLLEQPGGGTIDTALYPLAPWSPKDGYRLDPALLNAFIRQESRFKPAATNKTSGATGLLQLMPRTALSINKTTRRDELTNPETSLMLGQKYLEELLDRTDGNLFEAAIAYNAGPGNLSSWKQRFKGVDDALLFIEMIPYGETRNYVERVMANYWIYSLRMGVGVASLDAVAGGGPARYAHAGHETKARFALAPAASEIVLGAAQETSASSR